MRRGFGQLGGDAVRWLVQPTGVLGFVRQFCGTPPANRYRTILKSAEVLLWIIAVASIGYCSVAYAGAAVHQYREKALLKAGRVAPDATIPASVDTATIAASRGLGYGVLGVIEIPRLAISSVVEEGVDSSTLWEAVGHIPGTAMPGEAGNSALAAHRDTYFRGLGDVEIRDVIVFRSPTANFRYRVESMRIVEADATDALPHSATPTLSLVTCYPFLYVGPAPKRFIVTARAESSPQ
jgi:LPXTG-site transpeptidase (sortase) family protein